MRLTRRKRAAAAAVIALALLGALILLREPVARVLDPAAVASLATVRAQGEAAERAIARGHAKATDQLRRTRELRLSISDGEAALIAERGEDAVGAIRRDALVALAAALNLRGQDVAAYVTAAEARISGNDFEGEPGVLLAPTLYAVVVRANELFAQAADTTTRELTRPPSPSPTRSAPTPSPTGR